MANTSLVFSFRWSCNNSPGERGGAFSSSLCDLLDVRVVCLFLQLLIFFNLFIFHNEMMLSLTNLSTLPGRDATSLAK